MRTQIIVGVCLLSLSCGPPTTGTQPPPPTPVERARRPSTPVPRRPVKVTYDGFFEKAALRIDLAHSGTAKRESYEVVGLVKQGAWAGSRTQLIDPFPYGANAFEIRDVATGAVLYTRGFGSLFDEWQFTREAKKKTKTFSESVLVPQPKARFEIRLYERLPGNKLKLIHKSQHEPKGAHVKTWKKDPAAVVTALHTSGPASKKLDILIIGDGYTASEKEKFLRDARRFEAVMLRDPTFGAYKAKLNIRALFVPSKHSGVSEPRKGRLLDTPLGLSFDTFGSARYLMTEQNLKLRNVAANAPYDALYLLANTSRYGGGGIFNLYSTFPSDNEYDEYVFIHEFGHSFGGLADEYFTSETSTENMYTSKLEPADPNITAFLNGKFKWKALVKKGTPIPTPPTEKYRNVVGLFEGAGYKARGLYRAQLDCKMKGKGHVDFCRVCSNAIARMITLYSE